MIEFIFVWVLAMPKESHTFDTEEACNRFRADHSQTYGMRVPHCHKAIYQPKVSQ